MLISELLTGPHCLRSVVCKEFRKLLLTLS